MHPKSSQISVDGFLFLDQTIWRMQKKKGQTTPNQGELVPGHLAF